MMETKTPINNEKNGKHAWIVGLKWNYFIALVTR